MKIIYIASSQSIHSLRWIKFFTLKNKIIWITNSEPNKETINEFKDIKNKVKIYNIRKRKDFLDVIRVLLFESYSFVHLHYLGWHSLLTIFMRRKAKLILTPWGSDLLLKKNYLKKIWLTILFKKAEYTICDSERLKNISIKYGANKNNILVSMFGIDTNIYKASNKVFNNKDKVYVGSNRKLEKIYDIFTLLKSAKAICKKREDIIFLIAGNGSLSDNVKSFINQENLNQNIILLGLLNKKEMINFYNSIDIYVSTSLSDGGLSSSIAEAMSFERVVVVTNNSDNSFWIKDLENGYLFNNKDYKKLEELIENISAEREKNKEIAKSARTIIETHYSYQKEMRKVEKIYDIYK